MKFSTLLTILVLFSTPIFTFGQTNTTHPLPELLVSNSGKKIKNVSSWEKKRRKELIDLYETHVYGTFPKEEIEIRHEVTSTDENALGGKAIQKNIIIHFIKERDTVKADLLIYLPKKVKQPAPLFLGLNFFGNHSVHLDKNIPLPKGFIRDNPAFYIFNNTATDKSRGVRTNRWSIERILDRGYGIATMHYGDFAPDNPTKFQEGIYKLLAKEQLKNTGAIAAWSYGLSAAMDYLVKDNSIDNNKIAVFGHSRLGKAALWAGALDERFAMVISNDSGCGGAALFRRDVGEDIEAINRIFPHWFTPEFHKYAEKEEELPVDQHMLLALIAPRPVYVGSAEQDVNADPYGEYLSLYHANPAYELYGFNTLPSESLPELNKPLLSEMQGYHIRGGAHDMARFDWESYMDFADGHFK
ncbi:alpha/beta hydrolase family protein [Galbibacter mesophilus]|uniref:alpha/beta hydrolase family protein n=1 Tax=Galbibacter mesophilus TaxID=379069 RepID=UPI00191D8229|nr:acetylxylan esterase [Galbibacter mesophilus]MCM5662765.1 acetylxylan esterase [Galbibacter mesophilus]